MGGSLAWASCYDEDAVNVLGNPRLRNYLSNPNFTTLHLPLAIAASLSRLAIAVVELVPVAPERPDGRRQHTDVRPPSPAACLRRDIGPRAHANARQL